MDLTSFAFILIAMGLVFLVAEIFIPTGGVLFVLALCGLVGGVAMTFMYAEPFIGWCTFLGVFLIVPFLARIAFHFWPRTPMGRHLFLDGPRDDATVASMPVNVELEQLRGKMGRTISALRPAGVTDFEGRRIDTITEGMMVEPGCWVRCVDVRAGKVIVRPVAKPNLDTLENADFG